ncbi:hypothetical protein ACFWN2_30075 [Lentzea sp. NPDC058436]|uniref:hypothetical protein n=1 Tax=Lentzea sp. NPDC058436 TaxID=3346499 RepID=UPI003659AA7D
MNRSLAFVTIAAALGLAACTSTPDTAAPPTSSTTTTAPSTPVVTEVVTETVTKPIAPPVKPVIDSFGYGALKLGMTLQQALDTKLVGPNLYGEPNAPCSFHDVIGTGGKVYISRAKGVSSIFFTSQMSSDGVGQGVTEAKLKSEYTNLKDSYGTAYTAAPDGNPNAYFHFSLDVEGKVGSAALNINGQDCHS